MVAYVRDFVMIRFEYIPGPIVYHDFQCHGEGCRGRCKRFAHYLAFRVENLPFYCYQHKDQNG